jgi:hypothetical protein
MNECVKTGLRFQCIDDGTYRVGDLFYHELSGQFQIRGIPDRLITNDEVERKWLDVKVLNCAFLRRKDDVWLDSNLDITLIDPSPEFAAHIREWYPELIDRILGVKDDSVQPQ